MNLLARVLMMSLLAGTSLPVFARESATPSVVYTTQHDLMAKAIRVGQARGVMQGDLANLFRQQFQSSGVLLAHARVIQSFPRKDCKRLEVVYTQQAVQTPKGLTDAVFRMQLNYCLDGLPPTPAEMGVKEKP